MNKMKYFLTFLLTFISLNSFAQIGDSTFCEIPITRVTDASFYHAIDSLIEFERSNGRSCDEKSSIQAVYLSANKLLCITKFERVINPLLPQSMLKKFRTIKYRGLTILMTIYDKDIPEWIEDGVESYQYPCYDDDNPMIYEGMSDEEFYIPRTAIEAIYQDGVFKVMDIFNYQ